MLTDITEFSIPAGKVYLSPIIDCFDGMVTTWNVSTKPDADLVNQMLDTYYFSLANGDIQTEERTIAGQDGLKEWINTALREVCQRKAALQITQHVKDFLAE